MQPRDGKPPRPIRSTRLDPDVLQERIDNLASVRGESVDDVFARFTRRQLRRVPPKFKHVDWIQELEVADSGVTDGVAFIELADGSKYYGHPSRRNHERQYIFVADLVSDQIGAETYLLAKDVASRRVKDPIAVLPEPGGTMVEVGAYLGHKTIRYAEDALNRVGSILAIEMLPENVDILGRNVVEHGLEDVITVASCGVWNRSGVTRVKGVGRQRNSLVDLDGLPDSIDIEVPTRTLDELLDQWGHDRCDFMLVTANGAELEALEGLQAWAPRVRVIRINAGAKRDGRPTRDRCLELLDERGFVPLSCAGATTLYAAQRDVAPEVEAGLKRNPGRARFGWRRQ